MGLNQAGIGLTNVHKASIMWAADHDAAYPPHVAVLRANNYFRAKLLRDPRLPEGTVWSVGEVDARPFLEEIVRHHSQERLDRTDLLDAVERDRANAASPFYRFGDYFFVRLDRPRSSASLVYGWTLPDEEDRRFVVYDNGETHRTDADDWPAVWKRDAEARAALGLPPVDPPR